MNVQITQPVHLDGFETVSSLFWHRVTTRGDKVAMREKDRGIWKSYTWGQYGAAAKAIGSGLIALGLQPGEHAAILSENNKEWLYCDLGVLCAAGISTQATPRSLATRLPAAASNGLPVSSATSGRGTSRSETSRRESASSQRTTIAATFSRCAFSPASRSSRAAE